MGKSDVRHSVLPTRTRTGSRPSHKTRCPTPLSGHALLGRNRHEVEGRGSPPVPNVAAELELHGPTISNARRPRPAAGDRRRRRCNPAPSSTCPGRSVASAAARDDRCHDSPRAAAPATPIRSRSSSGSLIGRSNSVSSCNAARYPRARCSMSSHRARMVCRSSALAGGSG